MKTNLLNIVAGAALVALTPAQAQEKKEPAQASASSTVTANADGTATVTIEVNGKKETQTFKLGDGKPFTLKLQDGNSVAVAGSGAVIAVAPKKEKLTWLGVATEPVGEDVRAQLSLKEGEGLSITHVALESPAAKSGIAQHDILTRFNGQILVSADQLKSLVKMHKPGEKVKVSTMRKGLAQDIEVTLEEHEAEVRSADMFRRFLDEPALRQRNFLKDFNADDAQGGLLRKHLKDLKDKFPDVIVDRKAVIVGPDGKTKTFEGDFKVKELLDEARKHIDESKIPGNVREQILKSVESAAKAGSDILKETESGVSELRKEVEQLRKELEKTRGELEKAKETPKP